MLHVRVEVSLDDAHDRVVKLVAEGHVFLAQLGRNINLLALGQIKQKDLLRHLDLVQHDLNERYPAKTAQAFDQLQFRVYALLLQLPDLVLDHTVGRLFRVHAHFFYFDVLEDVETIIFIQQPP